MKVFNPKFSVALMVVSFVFVLASIMFMKPTFPRPDAKTSIDNLLQVSQEWAYFQGQKDALNGDMRIQYDSQIKKYFWKKSCWNGGMQPIFDPLKSEDIGYFLR